MGRTRSNGPRWGEQEARAALKALSGSGLSAAAFARRGGFSTQRLAYWRSRLGETEARPTFVSVSLPAAPTSSPPRQVEIAVGDVVVRVREDFDVEKLAEMVLALSRRIAAC